MMKITACPRKCVPDEVWEAIVTLEEHDRPGGLPPVLGGSLDQCAGYLNLRSEYQNVLNRLGIPSNGR